MANPFEADVEKALVLWRCSHQAPDMFVRLVDLLDSHDDNQARGETLQRSAKNESIIHKAWVTIFHERDLETGINWTVERLILAGIVRHDRWRTFLSSERDARAFVLLCARFLWMCETAINSEALKAGRDIRIPIRQQLQEALGQWLSEKDTDTPLSQRDLAVAFFGEAWCVLIYDPRPEWISIAAILANETPDFLPGRLDTEIAPFAEELPSL